MSVHPSSFFWLNEPSFQGMVKFYVEQQLREAKDIYSLSAYFAIHQERVDVFEKLWDEIDQSHSALHKEIFNMLIDFVLFDDSQFKMVHYMTKNPKDGLKIEQDQAVWMLHALSRSENWFEQGSRFTHGFYLSLLKETQESVIEKTISEKSKEGWPASRVLLEYLAPCCQEKDQEKMLKVWHESFEDGENIDASIFPFMVSLMEKQAISEAIDGSSAPRPSKRM